MVEEFLSELVFNSGSMTADANGNFITFTERMCNGAVKKIVLKAVNAYQSGTVCAFISGTGEVLMNTGSATGAATASGYQYYPMVYGVNTAGVTGSPTLVMQPVVAASDSCIGVWGSGLGAGSSASMRIIFGRA